MSIELLNATSASNSAFRVVCGEMSLNDKCITHHEALFGHVKNGSVTFEGTDGGFHLHEGDIYFVSPNTRYRLTNSNSVNIDVITIHIPWAMLLLYHLVCFMSNDICLFFNTFEYFLCIFRFYNLYFTTFFSLGYARRYLSELLSNSIYTSLSMLNTPSAIVF